MIKSKIFAYIFLSFLLHSGLFVTLQTLTPLLQNEIKKPKPSTLFVTLSVPKPKAVKQVQTQKTKPAIKKKRIQAESIKSKPVVKSKRVEPKYSVTSKAVIETKKEVKASNEKIVNPDYALLAAQDGQKLATRYAQQLKVYIEQNKKYPRIAVRLKHSGTVRIKLTINSDGTFQDIRVIDPSNFNSLNKAAVELLTKLERFKPAPEWQTASKEFVVPIIYSLRRKI